MYETLDNLTPKQIAQIASETGFEEWEVRLRIKVNDFYRENIHWFKLDQYYGLDIDSDIAKFVVECVKEYKK